jgi:hypothetical protein
MSTKPLCRFGHRFKKFAEGWFCVKCDRSPCEIHNCGALADTPGKGESK